jgi:hypothetical protein
MAGDLAVLETVVSSAMEFTLGRSLDKTFQVEVVDELVVEFRKLEEWRYNTHFLHDKILPS